jgi:hypothetical protein
MPRIFDNIENTLLPALMAFPLVAKFVKIAALNACRDVERG